MQNKGEVVSVIIIFNVSLKPIDFVNVLKFELVSMSLAGSVVVMTIGVYIDFC